MFAPAYMGRKRILQMLSLYCKMILAVGRSLCPRNRSRRYGFTAASPISLPDKSSDNMLNPALDNSSRTHSIPRRSFL